MTILNYEILRPSKQEKDRDSTRIGNNIIYYVVRKIRKTRVEETRVYTKQQVCGTHDCSVHSVCTKSIYRANYPKVPRPIPTTYRLALYLILYLYVYINVYIFFIHNIICNVQN